MDIDLARVADAFDGLRVTVCGDPLLDTYLHGHVERLCREAPVPLTQVDTVRYVPGGAANVAANAVALGARVRLIGLIGADGDGEHLRTALHAAGVATDDVLTETTRRTIAKQRLIADGQMLARFDRGTFLAPSESCETALCERAQNALDDSDVVIVSDYGYGSVSDRVLAAVAARAWRGRLRIIADGRDLERLATLRPAAVKPSFAEARRLLGAHDGAPRDRVEWVTAQAETLLARAGARVAAVTLDSEGAIIIERGRAPYRTYARPAGAARSTGGGDTYVAGFSLALGAGADTPAAAEIAAAAAAVVVDKDGTATCSQRELREFIAGGEKRLSDVEALRERVQAARAGGRRIVFTNGCFDILHRGHVTLLNRAKGLGDLLIVGINTDASVARLKGPARPINSLEDRVKVLAALSYVDYILAFDADSPRTIIEQVRPDIYVKGGDYTRATLPEAGLVESLGGLVCILPLVEDRSTTHLIARIRAAVA